MRPSYGIRFRENVWSKLEQARNRGKGVGVTTNEAVDAYLDKRGGVKGGRSTRGKARKTRE